MLASKILDNRSKLYVWLITLGLLSFILSFAINNIVVWVLPLFFFVDTKSNIKTKLSHIAKNRTIWFYLIFFFTQVIGFFYSENKYQAIDRIVSMAPLALLPVVILTEKIDKKDEVRILKILKFSIPLIFILLLANHVFILNHEISTFVYFSVDQMLGVSQFYISFLLFVPLLISVQEILNKKNVLLNSLLAVITLFFLLLLKNITTLLFCTMVYLYISISLIRLRKIKEVMFMGLIGVAIVFVGFKTPMVKERLDFLIFNTDFDREILITKNRYAITKNTLEHRILINMLSMDQICANFPFGVGTGDIQEVLNGEYEKIHFKAAMNAKLNNHNQYLEEFLKTGILGGLSFVFLIVHLFLRAGNASFYHKFFITFFALGCFFESYLNRQHGVFILAFLIPIFMINFKHIFYNEN